jgi:uncharacterized repeat protein (TIGR01451 family)
MNLHPHNNVGQNGIGHAEQESAVGWGQCQKSVAFWRVPRKFTIKPPSCLAIIFLILCLVAPRAARASPGTDLAIGMSATPTNALVGNMVVFTISLTNLGSATVNDVVGSDVVPSGFSIYAWSSSGSPDAPVYNPTNGGWTVAAIGPGVVDTLTISNTATNSGIYTNTALITSPSTGSSSAVVTVTPQTADLLVTKTAALYEGPDTNLFQPGQMAIFTITITNPGPGTAYNILGSDVLPAGFAFAGWGNDGSGYYPQYDSTNGDWTLYELPPDNWGQFSIYATAASDGTFTNTAAITNALVLNPNPSNDTASVVVTVAPPQADLMVIKVAQTNYVSLTNQITFSVTLTNLGPANVTNQIVVTDCLPAGFQYVTDNTYGNPANGVYSPGTCAWTLSSGLAASNSMTLIITVSAISAGVFTNVATAGVPAGYTDPNLANNTASVVVTNVASVTGYVRGCQANGGGIAQVEVTLLSASGATYMAVTDTNGFYGFTNVMGGNCTVSPSQAGNTFSPLSTSFLLATNTVLAPFISSMGLIQGTLSYGANGPGVGGVPVQLTGTQTRTVITDTNGNYLFKQTPAGAYTVTPVPTNGYVFAPTNQMVTLTGANCIGRANFVSQPRVVLLVALEVTQVIQDWNNSVQLIQNKETYVRAHFQLTLTNTNSVLLQGASLYNGAASLTPLPSTQLLVAWTNASVRPIRESLTNCLLFRLPSAWLSGTINLRFVCTNNVTVIPTNVVPANSTVQVTFVPAPTLPIRLFPVQWTNGGVAAGLQQNSAANLADVPRRLLSMYPVPSVDCQQAPPLIMTNTTPPPYPEINGQLLSIRFLDAIVAALSRGAILPPGNRIYHGAVAGSTLYAQTGVADLPGFIGSGLMPQNNNFYSQLYLRHLATHEIGHNLNRQHTASAAIFGSNDGDPKGGCGETAAPGTVYPLYQSVAGLYVNKPALGPMNNGSNSLIYGLDTLTLKSAPQYNPLASPYVLFDVMSYCATVPQSLPLSWWISTYNYSGIYTYATNTFGTAPGPPAPGPTNNWLLFRGEMDLTLGTAAFLPTLEVATPITPPSPATGSYTLILYDSQHNVLDQISFQPDVEEVEEGEDQSALFIIPVLANPAFHEMAISNGTSVIADVVGSDNQPSVNTVTVTSTNGGAFGGSGQMNISWVGSDANPSANLTYTILYSADGGTNWQTLAVDWPSESYSLDSTPLPASTQGVIEIMASDGFNNSAPAYSASFTILNHPPTVYINAPLNDTLFVADDQIFLDATVIDPQDGTLNGASVQWTSSIDGALGSGDVINLEADSLSEGVHTITVTATDSLGLTNSATVTIIVLRAPPPALSVALSGQTVLLSWDSCVTNYVLVSAGSLPATTWSVVTNAPEGLDSIQTVTLPLTSSNAFFQLLRQ